MSSRQRSRLEAGEHTTDHARRRCRGASFRERIEDAGMEWPHTDTIGPDGWHYQLRATMAAAIEALIKDPGRKGGAVMTESVKDILFDLEHPIFEASSLAKALAMTASSDELRGEPGQAVAVVESPLLGYLQTIKGAWEALSDLTNGEQAGPKPTVKKRALRVVETDDGSAA
jgi:hypothetical protein